MTVLNNNSSTLDTATVHGLVSTVIPVFNRPKMLVKAVNSVLEQTYRPIQILIADDGSTDETPEVASQIRDAHSEIVEYVRHDNSGPGPTRELGRKLATGEFIQYLDSDDRLLPNKFADQIAALREHPHCDIAYGTTRLVDLEGNVLTDPFKWTDRTIEELYPGLLVDRWWSTHTPLYRRSLTDKIGPWSDLRWSQDWEYDSRAGAMRVKLVHCGSPVSEHTHHQSMRQTSASTLVWTSDPSRLKNRVSLLSSLWNGAVDAGVPETSDERQHFARWCFAIARQCASQGLTSETSQLVNLAKEAAGSGPSRRGISQFEFARTVVGTKIAGQVFRMFEKLRNSQSNQTMSQSFTGQV